MKATIALILISVCTISELIAYMPQIIKIFRTKSADDLSLASWLIWIISDICYLAYVLIESPEIGVIFLAALSLALVLFVFILTLFYQEHKPTKKKQHR
ncbi:MAG: PQ-loop repeat-containing protein [Alphaproteobacteria bacterium]|nr:PQ-loop repeat-containing protein [Alphaproteobacteria bacterium]